MVSAIRGKSKDHEKGRRAVVEHWVTRSFLPMIVRQNMLSCSSILFITIVINSINKINIQILIKLLSF